MLPRDEQPEIGRDALDPAEPVPLWAQFFPARHAALGLRASPAPALTFVLAGVVLGPQGLALLTSDTLAELDPVVSIALAALGIFVGLGIGSLHGAGQSRLFASAFIEATLTIVVVGGVMYALLLRWAIPMSVDTVLFAAALGVCASASAATRRGESAASVRVARLVDLDDVALVALGTLVVLLAGSVPSLQGIAIMAVSSLLVGVAGWLLFERAHGDAERGVFVAGGVALLGGVGAYADSSPLLSGALAALVWVRSPGHADRIISADLRKLQHPLVALLLIVAGASVQWTYAVLWIAAPLVLLRLTGKLLASTATARIAALPASLLATVLVPPGVLGVALALNIQQVLRTGDTLLLSVVTVAAGASELVAMLLPTDAEERA